MIRKSVHSLHAYVPGEQPTDPEIVKLNTNENPYPPSPEVERVLRELDPASLRKYPDPVCRELREVIAEQHGASPDQVIVGNGSDELLALCLRAFVERDGAAGWFEPSYSLYPVLTAIEDLRACVVPLGEGFTWPENPQPACSLFFITNPNAPTSLLYEKDTVADFCARFDGVVVIDEAYVDFARFDCMDLALERDNVLVLRTLSKSYSLASIRCGYAVGPVALIEALFKIKDSYNVNGLTQAVALAALRDRPHMEQQVEQVLSTRERVAQELMQRGHEVFRSDTNFLWMRPMDGDAEGLFHRLREAKIVVRYFPGALTGEYLRITIGTSDEMWRFTEAIREEG